MDAYPDNHPDGAKCWPGGSLAVNANTIKALCNVAAKVTVTGAGVVKWAPVVLDSYGYGGPGPYVNLTNMSCQKHNASGLITSKWMLQGCPDPDLSTCPVHPRLMYIMCLSCSVCLLTSDEASLEFHCIQLPCHCCCHVVHVWPPARLIYVTGSPWASTGRLDGCGLTNRLNDIICGQTDWLAEWQNWPLAQGTACTGPRIRMPTCTI
jgi:hypothetical protein